MFNRTVAIVLLVALFAGLGLLASRKYFTEPATPQPALRAVKLFPQPRELPPYALQQSDGTQLVPGELHGHWTLVFIGFTFCPDVCPTTLARLAQAQKQWEALPESTRPRVLFVSVDPERDTPAALATYTRFFDPRIVGLTGSPALIQGVARNFKVRYAKVARDAGDPKLYAVDHSAGLYLLGPDSRFIKKYGYGTPAQAIADELRDLIRQP